MGRGVRWRTATPLPLGLPYWRSVLARVTWLALTGGACALLIIALVASSVSAQAWGAPVVTVHHSHTPHPTRTPRKTPPVTVTSSPTPPVTVVPSPTSPATGAPSPTPPVTSAPDQTTTPSTATATLAPTAAATETIIPGAGKGGSAGSGDDHPQAADGPPGLLPWGIVPLMLLALVVFGVLEARRALHSKEHQRALGSTAQGRARAWLNHDHQEYPLQKAAAPTSAKGAAEQTVEQDHLGKSLLASQEVLSAPLTPPSWLVDAGLLPQDPENVPPEDEQ